MFAIILAIPQIKQYIRYSLATHFFMMTATLCVSINIQTALATTNTWVANGDNTVSDLATGLIWQQHDDDITRTHTDAISYCETLVLGQESNWRLPNAKELVSMVDYRVSTPDSAVNRLAFPSTKPASYWTSTDSVTSGASTIAFSVNFVDGKIDDFFKTNTYFVRCVN